MNNRFSKRPGVCDFSHIAVTLAVFCIPIILLSFITTTVLAQEKTDHPEYVTSKTCVDCHQEQKTLWDMSDHSWAWLPATQENVLGNFDNAVFEHHGVTTRFFIEMDKFWIETENETGDLQKYEIKHIVGVKPLQQYLIEQDGGRLQVLDIAWDTVANKWFMVFPQQNDNIPGNALHWTGVYKNWNGRCAECHATDFKKNYDMPTRSFSSTWSEPGVTCEACHGPGQAHIQWAEQPDIFELKAYLGITENGLRKVQGESPAEREIQLCSGCHSRRATFTGDSPLPGSAFSDGYDLALLRPDLYHFDGQIKDEVYVLGSFMQSKMYAAGVTCSDCHNPHSGQVKTTENGLCTQCHNNDGNARFSSLQKKDYDSPSHHNHPVNSTGAQCVSCHMPETTYMQVDARRDHRFGIPNPHDSAAIGTPNACMGCHADNDNNWAIKTLKEWFPNSDRSTTGFAVIFNRVTQFPSLETDVVDLMSIAENTDLPAIIRATALEKLLPYSTALTWQNIVPYLTHGNPYIRTAATRLFQQSPPAIAVENLMPRLSDKTRTVRIAAARSLITVSPAVFTPAQRQLFSTAFIDYQKFLLAGADHPSTQMGLAGLALSFRNIPAAMAAINEALAIDPQMSDAWIMKANIENAQRRPDLVEQTMKDAKAALPNSSVIHQYFGNYLASQRQYDLAITSLEKAVALSDSDPAVLTDYAAVLGQSGKYSETLIVLDTLLDKQPDNVTALFLKANAHLEMGQKGLSRKTVQRLLAINPDFPLPEALLD
jgi:predicted CXXCH cytochrome family protein